MRVRLEILAEALLLAGLAWGGAQPKTARCEPLPAGVDREEHFVLLLNTPGSSAQRPSVLMPVGLARLRARGGERSQVEFEARLFEEDLRVQQVESVDARGMELVWREWRAGQGRTLRARAERGALEIVEWGRPEVLRVKLAAPEPLWLPLHLLEAGRARASIDSALYFDPLGRRTEVLKLHRAGGGAEPGRWRWSDSSGACAGEFRFEGESLAEFRWQAGVLSAKSIDAAEYGRIERVHAAARGQR